MKLLHAAASYYHGLVSYIKAVQVFGPSVQGKAVMEVSGEELERIVSFNFQERVYSTLPHEYRCIVHALLEKELLDDVVAKIHTAAAQLIVLDACMGEGVSDPDNFELYVWDHDPEMFMYMTNELCERISNFEKMVLDVVECHPGAMKAIKEHNKSIEE